MVRNLYNALAKFEGLYRYKAYPVHKKINFGIGSEIEDLDDWLCKYVKLDANSYILDAGCGNGNTLFKLVETYSCKGLGISLSDLEIRKATGFSKKRAPLINCRFLVHDFEKPLPGKFDLIYAIESIKHSANIENVIRNFADQLNPKSLLIIVDDFTKKEVSNKYYLSFLEKTWFSKTLKENYIIEKAHENNLKLIDSIDFTDKIHKMPVEEINHKIKMLTLLRKTIPLKYFRNITDIFIAGFMLDFFYAKDEMAYKALIFEKLN